MSQSPLDTRHLWGFIYEKGFYRVFQVFSYSLVAEGSKMIFISEVVVLLVQEKKKTKACFV